MMQKLVHGSSLARYDIMSTFQCVCDRDLPACSCSGCPVNMYVEVDDGMAVCMQPRSAVCAADLAWPHSCLHDSVCPIVPVAAL